MSESEDQELMDSFVVESLDMLDEVEPIFVELGAASSLEMNDDAIGAAFRLYHSIKGASSFLGFSNVTSITHVAETLLGLLRTGSIAVSSEFVSVQLDTIDLLRTILLQVKESGNDAGFETQGTVIIRQLESVMHKEAVQPEAKDSVEAPVAPADDTEPLPAIDVSAEPDTNTELDVPEFEISDEMRTRFCQDSAEALDEAEQSLLALERSAGEERTSLVADAFRHLHSFKGNCGFMQLGDLEKLSHKMETVLGSMRDGVIEPTDANIGILLKTLDLLKKALGEVGEGGTGEIISCRAMLQFIDEMMVGSSSPASVADEPLEAEQPAPPLAEPVVIQKDVAAAEDIHDELRRAVELQKATISKESISVAGPSGAAPESAAPRAAATPSASTAQSGGSIRVDVEKLDLLINLVGELIIAEAMVLRNPTLLDIEDEALERAIHQLKRVSTDLQDVAMSVRMIPLAATFRRMIRLVHDTAKKSGKQATLNLVGEDTEVDKNVIEQIGDPLVHIIRNSVDHGIEPPDERVELGKPSEGTVTIEARHEGGEVWIIIRDDGRGLDRARILAKAGERGLLKGPADEYSDEDIFGMIFHPGFSTAEKVTDISGRGVGMDVVKKNIEKLNGKVRVKSIYGEGTDIILQIPLTMAIIDGMLVRVGGGLYTLPLLVIRECIPHPAKERFTITPDGVESILVRGEMIPVLRLHNVFKKVGAETDLSKGILVVVQTEGEPIALLVDELVGQQETVIKGLSGYLGNARGISGCTVLGNGEVSLIIDVAGLVAMREERSDHE